MKFDGVKPSENVENRRRHLGVSKPGYYINWYDDKPNVTIDGFDKIRTRPPYKRDLEDKQERANNEALLRRRLRRKQAGGNVG